MRRRRRQGVRTEKESKGQEAQMKEFNDEVSKKLSVHKEKKKEKDDSDEDSDACLDEAQKEKKIKERKTSEQRIVAIVHSDAKVDEEYLDSLESAAPLERSIAQDISSESSQQR